MLTAGNAGMALANTFKSLGLPQPKLLLDKHTSPQTIEKLKKAGADIYVVDLATNPFSGLPSDQAPLTPGEILTLTNNRYGKDLTSSNSEEDLIAPEVIYYQDLAEQIFKETPDEIYVPYGSGALFGEIVVRQNFNVWDVDEGKIRNQVAQTKILGAEPKNPNSIADKLTAPAKPFPTQWEKALNIYKEHGETNEETGIEKIAEEDIITAYELLKRRGAPLGIETEPSATAGLALYMRRWREGKIKKDAKIIVVNTGKGVISDPKEIEISPRQVPKNLL